MKSFFSSLFLSLFILTFSIEGVHAESVIRYDSYGNAYIEYREPIVEPVYYRERPAPVYRSRVTPTYRHTSVVRNSVVCPSFSSASVGVGTISNGVNISVVSYDTTIQKCIKNTSWLSYFTSFGNSVSIKVSNTTLGVQILATSYEESVIARLQNTQWSSRIKGNTDSYVDSSYDPYNSYYVPPAPVYNTQTYNPYYYNPNSYPLTPVYNTAYTNTNYQYRTGTSIFGYGTRSLSRSLTNLSNGVRMTFLSADYDTANFLQNYMFSSIFSQNLYGISISQNKISGGVEVTVTAGSSSTVREIQNIAYALVYQ
jgi:hypothetical protein